MRKLLTAASVLVLLGACAGRHETIALRGPAGAYPANPSEAVWHLRIGLNVAALLCRGRDRTSVAGGYARLLTHHRGLLAAAYRAEQQRQGSGLERHETRLYNRFSNQHNPGAFCARAAEVAASANAMGSARLAQEAGRLLDRID